MHAYVIKPLRLFQINEIFMKVMRQCISIVIFIVEIVKGNGFYLCF